MSVLEILRIPLICIEVLLLFNLLIFVHEMGHFLAARWRGLYVEEFALWFGKPLWRKKIGGVWYALNSLPFGGYVKLPQMAPMEAIEGSSENLPPEARSPIKPLDKIIVAFAGPLFSFLLAVFFAFVVWQVGKPVREAESTQTIGYVLPASPAAAAGLQPGDVITAIDGKKVSHWHGMSEESLVWRIITSEGETVKLDYLRNGQPATAEAKPTIPPTKFYQRSGTRQIGILPAEIPRVASVEEGKAAANAGLQKGDRIVKANGKPVYLIDTLEMIALEDPAAPLMLTVTRNGAEVALPTPLDIPPPSVDTITKDSPAESAGIQVGDKIAKVNGQRIFGQMQIIDMVTSSGEKPLTFELDRNGTQITVPVTPRFPIDDTTLRIGILFKDDDLGLKLDASGVIHPKPWDQVRDSALSIVNTISVIASSKSDVGVQHLGGPAMMLNIYYRLFQSEEGWRLALWFSVLLNVNLALLNMLPLPVLDGGHITLALFEIIRRRPIQGEVETKILEWVQTGTAMVLIGFMLFVTVFDVQDWFGGGKPTMKFAPRPSAESTR